MKPLGQSPRSGRRLLLIATVSAVSLAMTSCTQGAGDRVDTTAGPDTTAGADGVSDGTFVFGSTGPPKNFDPFYASDGETARVTNQMYDSLLRLQPGTVEVEPALATEWSGSEDGLSWTFKLRDGVTFHDGTPFNAEAACFNFDRWYNQTGVAQSTGVTQYWSNDFGTFSDKPEGSLFKSCAVDDDSTITLALTRASSKFPVIMSFGGYSFSSPTALEKWDANNVAAQGTGFTYPAYAMEHPTGTGPFKFVEYDSANATVTLERNEDYWGEKAKVKTLVFRIIADETTRRQELEAGTIDAYDIPNPVDWADLEAGGYQILLREQALNLLYVGLNATNEPALKDLRVRQALMYAIDKEKLVKTQLPEAAVVATQFIPSITPGYAEKLEPYEYDVEKAKALLAEAGQSGLELEFWYPTEVSRPYMPNPKRVADAVREDWEAAGINVVPVAKPWAGGFLDGREQDLAPSYILGTIAHYNLPIDFLNVFFGVTDNAFATNQYEFGDELAAALKAADSEPDPDKRDELWQELNTNLMVEWLPSLPIAHVPSALAASPRVSGLVASPISAEVFNTVQVEE